MNRQGILSLLDRREVLLTAVNCTLVEVLAVMLAMLFLLQPQEHVSMNVPYYLPQNYAAYEYSTPEAAATAPTGTEQQKLRINQAGVELIKHFEGFRPTVYRDEAGHRTIGYGHKMRKGENFTKVTEAQAEALLIHDLMLAEAAVQRHVKVQLTDNQYAALVSFVYNVGPANFAESTLLKRINQGKLGKAQREFQRWTKVDGEPKAGLERRRAAEADLFLASAL